MDSGGLSLADINFLFEAMINAGAGMIGHGNKRTLENYLEFLKSGWTKSPVELLKAVGVNPLEDNLYKEAFEGFKKALDEFKRLALE